MRRFLNSTLGRLIRMLPPKEVLEGFEHPELIEMMFRKACDFSPTRRWEEFASRSAVLDFGGGFGQHYKCATPLSREVRWAVVETPAVVQRASVLASDRLRFFTSVAEAADWLGAIDLMHSDGALHYAPDPTQALRKLCALAAKEMLWKRTFLSETDRTEIEDQLSRLDENGPRVANERGLTVSRKLARYRITRIPEADFLAMHSAYELIERNAGNFRFIMR
jgi:putative methyltransferase (TIGR04325 family)